jgi:hypothetical protein
MRRPLLTEKTRGITLVETLAMIAIVGTISSLCAVAIHRATMTQKSIMRAIQIDKLLQGLHTQLLRDTHNANQIAGADAKLVLTDQLGATVEYRLEASAIQRRSKKDGLQWEGITTWNVDAVEFGYDQGQQPGSVVHYRLRLNQAAAVTAPPVTPAASQNTTDSGSSVIQPGTPGSPGTVSISATDQIEIQWTARLGVGL